MSDEARNPLSQTPDEQPNENELIAIRKDKLKKLREERVVGN